MGETSDRYLFIVILYKFYPVTGLFPGDSLLAKVVLYWRNSIKNILGECLLISSLPGKALRTLVDIARLAERFNMRSQSHAW